MIPREFFSAARPSPRKHRSSFGGTAGDSRVTPSISIESQKPREGTYERNRAAKGPKSKTTSQRGQGFSEAVIRIDSGRRSDVHGFPLCSRYGRRHFGSLTPPPHAPSLPQITTAWSPLLFGNRDRCNREIVSDYRVSTRPRVLSSRKDSFLLDFYSVDKKFSSLSGTETCICLPLAIFRLFYTRSLFLEV